jgi:hypothetical protein
MQTLRIGWLACMCSLGALQGAAPAPQDFRIAVVSDFHMALDKLKNAFADAASLRIDTMVIVGDSCDGQDHEYAAIQETLRSAPHPAHLFFTMGNHEYYAGYHRNGGEYDERGFPNGETSAKCRERFNRFRGADPAAPVYYDAWVKGCHFIFLGGERSRMDDPGFLDDAVLTQAQLGWLKAKLMERARPDRPIFVFLHQPFPDTVSGSRNATSIQQHRELRAILSRYPQVLFFSGDTHWELNLPTTHYTDHTFGIHLFNTSSLRDPYNVKDEAIARNMSEGLMVQVLPGEVIIKGRNFLGHAFIPGQTYAVRLR